MPKTHVTSCGYSHPSKTAKGWGTLICGGFRREIKEGVHEDEAEFVVAVKAANPKIAASELKSD
jgi:hypothetical protein